MGEYLEPGRCIDSDHPALVEFAEKSRGSSRDPVEQAVRLYYAVRDGIRYNPYIFSRDPQTLKGSHALLRGCENIERRSGRLEAVAVGESFFTSSQWRELLRAEGHAAGGLCAALRDSGANRSGRCA